MRRFYIVCNYSKISATETIQKYYLYFIFEGFLRYEPFSIYDLYIEDKQQQKKLTSKFDLMQCSRQTDITWKVYNIHIHMFWRVREKLLCANWIWCCYALNLEAIRNDQPMIKKRLHASKHFYVILCLSTKLNRTTTTTSKYRKKNKSKRKATTTNKKKSV